MASIYLKNAKRFVTERHSVYFKMIRKLVCSKYLENQPIILTINPRIFPLLYWFYFLSLNGEIFWRQWPAIYLKDAKRFVREKYSVRFRMIQKDESFRYLESQPICMVTWSLYDDVITKYFLGKIFFFNWNRYLQQAVNIFLELEKLSD